MLFSDVAPPVFTPQDHVIVGTFGDGSILVLWQSGDDPAMLSQRSAASDDWSLPRNVSSSFSAVRDVRLVFVERGRVDLYYATDDGQVRRRPVYSHGGSSPEQRVNTGFAEDAAFPVPYRLPDCRILLTVLTTPDGVPAPLGVAILDRDAPAR